MSIHIRKCGQGKPLVFFHGFGFDHQIWQSIVPLLETQYMLFLVDLPGFGQTPGMDWDTFKQALVQQLPASYVLLGWSMGGLFATRLACELPEQVASLINIASSPCFVKKPNWPGIDASILAQFYKDLMRDPLTVLRQFIALQTNTNAILPDILPTGLQAGLTILQDWDLRESLRHFKQPVHYLFGRLDSIVPYQLMSVMQTCFPQVQCTLFPKAAHAPFLSHQTMFIDTLNGILK